MNLQCRTGFGSGGGQETGYRGGVGSVFFFWVETFCRFGRSPGIFVLEAGRGPGQGQPSLWAVSLEKVGEALACFDVFLFFCCLYLRFGLMGRGFGDSPCFLGWYKVMAWAGPCRFLFYGALICLFFL